MSLAEYQSQLSDIELLLADAPEDDALLKLKSDLLELIQLTASDEDGAQTSSVGQLHESSESQRGGMSFNDSKEPAQETMVGAKAAAAMHTGAAEAKSHTKIDKKLRKKVKKDFEIPEHLLPLESDTEAQRNKKRRTIKSLKSKHKAAQKEYESSKKQKSWLDFSKKKRKNKHAGDSIFKTADDGKVGVVTSNTPAQGTSSTNSSKRQRHVF